VHYTYFDHYLSLQVNIYKIIIGAFNAKTPLKHKKIYSRIDKGLEFFVYHFSVKDLQLPLKSTLNVKTGFMDTYSKKTTS
ncbi:MAG: hypothetical protein RPS47_04985, partial [Colwellia sp.]